MPLATRQCLFSAFLASRLSPLASRLSPLLNQPHRASERAPLPPPPENLDPNGVPHPPFPVVASRLLGMVVAGGFLGLKSEAKSCRAFRTGESG